MTETRTPYTTNAPQPQRRSAELTPKPGRHPDHIDLADAAIAAYLTDLVQANPQVALQ